MSDVELINGQVDSILSRLATSGATLKRVPLTRGDEPP